MGGVLISEDNARGKRKKPEGNLGSTTYIKKPGADTLICNPALAGEGVQ